VKPAFVQNRTFASTGWDRDVRDFCREHDIIYQGFSLLTANAPVLESRTVKDAAERVGHSPAAIIFRFALEVGMLPLTGTSTRAHMQADLATSTFELTPDEVKRIDGIARPL
jgi:diketogulonate reductase-like aldo/keto reductase